MSARLLPRRSVIVAALTLPAAAAQAQTPAPTPAAPVRPLLMQGKTTLFQRIITQPGATIAPRSDGQGAHPIDGFETYYVYARQGGDSGWVQVGRGAAGRDLGWVPAAKTIEWKHTLVGAFTNPAGRLPVLFLDNKEEERRLLLDLQAGDTETRMLAEAQAGRPGSLIAREPAAWANIEERFYLLPILNVDQVARETGPDLRLLEVISVPAPPPPQPPQDFKAAVVFLVDTTVSMQPYIDGTRAVIKNIVNRILATPMRDKFRFGLVAYRDSLEDTPALEYYARTYARPDFSQPPDAILPAIAQVQQARAQSQGFDEDPIGGLKFTLDDIPWDSISSGYRHVILITDAAARPGNHPHSVTRMGISEIKQAANRSGVTIWALHLLTEEGGRRPGEHQLAATQYKELTTLNETTQLYYPVPIGSPGQWATQPDFMNQADQLARALIAATARTAHLPVPDLGPASGPPVAQLARQMPVIEEAMRLAYLGHVEQTTAPDKAVRSWTTDHDLRDSTRVSLGIRVLLTKNQLSDLAKTLKDVLRLGREGRLEPENFFTELQRTVASAFRDAQEITRATQIGGLLGEFLDDLPYKSELLDRTGAEWRQMSSLERDAIMNRIDNKLSLYQLYDQQADKCYDLGHSHDPGERVYPVPIEALP